MSDLIALIVTASLIYISGFLAGRHSNRRKPAKRTYNEPGYYLIEDSEPLQDLPKSRTGYPRRF